MDPESEIKGLAVDKVPAGKFQARGTLQVPMDVLADTDTGKMHLLSRDAVNGLRECAQSDEGEMFSAFSAFFIQAVSTLLALYVAVYQGSLIVGKLIQAVLLALWAIAFASGGLAWYFYKKRKGLKTKQAEKFKKILEESQTVMVLNQPD